MFSNIIKGMVALAFLAAVPSVGAEIGKIDSRKAEDSTGRSDKKIKDATKGIVDDGSDIQSMNKQGKDQESKRKNEVLSDSTAGRSARSSDLATKAIEQQQQQVLTQKLSVEEMKPYAKAIHLHGSVLEQLIKDAGAYDPKAALEMVTSLEKTGQVLNSSVLSSLSSAELQEVVEAHVAWSKKIVDALQHNEKPLIDAQEPATAIKDYEIDAKTTAVNQVNGALKAIKTWVELQKEIVNQMDLNRGNGRYVFTESLVNKFKKQAALVLIRKNHNMTDPSRPNYMTEEQANDLADDIVKKKC